MREIENLYLKPSSFHFNVTHKLVILNIYQSYNTLDFYRIT